MAEIAITGASAGVGAAAAVRLTQEGHRVLALGRSPAKLTRVHAQLRQVAPRGADVPEPLICDLSSLRATRDAANVIASRCPRLDILVNNAGLEAHRRSLSADGFEITLAVNHLAPFLLTNLLVDRLKTVRGRVVTTASDTHLEADLGIDDLQLAQGWSTARAYARSKLANVLFTVELRRRTGLAASCFHPGAISTDLNRDASFLWLTKALERLRYGKPEEGADTLVWLATSDEGGAPHAVYYENRRPAEAAELAGDPELSRRLWDASKRLVSEALGEAVGQAVG